MLPGDNSNTRVSNSDVSISIINPPFTSGGIPASAGPEVYVFREMYFQEQVNVLSDTFVIK